jgi:hypothetical protein
MGTSEKITHFSICVIYHIYKKKMIVVNVDANTTCTHKLALKNEATCLISY